MVVENHSFGIGLEIECSRPSTFFVFCPFLQYMKAIRLTRLYIQFYAFNTNMNISGGDRLSLTALQRRLSKLCQKLPQKAILGLGEPIINSRILSGGFYLSQHLSITTKVHNLWYTISARMTNTISHVFCCVTQCFKLTYKCLIYNI